MADIARQAGLTPDQSAVTGASRLYFFLWDEAWQHAPGTLDGDAKALHDLRVQLRRLRTALSNFAGGKDAPLLSPSLRREARAQSAALSKLGDRLGAVRDADVLIEDVRRAAKKGRKKGAPPAPGLEKLLEELSAERERAFKPMRKSLRRAQREGGLREEFARWSLGLPGARTSPLALRDAAALIWPLRLEEIALGARALEGDDAEALHELRKSLRRARYTLETLSVCFNAPIEPPVKTLVALQDALGEMQDHAVLEATTRRLFGADAGGDLREFGEQGQQQRRELLETVRQMWAQTQQRGFWDELRALIPSASHV